MEGRPGAADPIAVHGTRKVQPGDRVVVFGAGSAGLAVTQMAHVRGAARVVTLDLYDNRLEIAKQLGADYTVNVRREDPLEAVPRLLGARPDVCIDVVGIPSVAGQCVELVRAEGNVTIFGTYHVEHDATFSLLQWEIKAISMNMSNEGSPQTAAEAMRLPSGFWARSPQHQSTSPMCSPSEVPKGLEPSRPRLLVPEAEMPADLPWNRDDQSRG